MRPDKEMALLHYLDNAATTPVDQDLADLCRDTMIGMFGNPSSLYSLGAESERALNRAREQVASTIGAAASEIVFTACGSESDNIALQGAFHRTKKWAKNIVMTGFEHPAVRKTIELFRSEGMEIRTIDPDENGRIDEQKFLEAIDDRTGIVTFMFVNNEIGTVLHPSELAGKVRKINSRASIHVDGVQGWCKHPIRLSAGLIDSFALSGHKMHCPKGIGALYLRKNYQIGPTMFGGGQEKGLRPGTENVPYIVTLGAAAEKYGGSVGRRFEKAASLNRMLREELSSRPVILNSPDDASPYVLNFSLPGIRSETMLHYLEEKEVFVSSGSACSRGAASHTLLAMGLPEERVDSALRISFSDQTNEEDIQALLTGIDSGIASLQRR